jgi:hypothetical protein
LNESPARRKEMSFSASLNRRRPSKSKGTCSFVVSFFGENFLASSAAGFRPRSHSEIRPAVSRSSSRPGCGCRSASGSPAPALRSSPGGWPSPSASGSRLMSPPAERAVWPVRRATSRVVNHPATLHGAGNSENPL